ncbi:MAG: DNA-processing protein DprA, partial [Eggerthellaceae bacterium]|nr:DNA-processing protein DprA [Eggerthellaceae bacterium]
MQGQAIAASERCVIGVDDRGYPTALAVADRPPRELYVVGDPDVLSTPMVAIVGPRKATPYGLACARRFAALAAQAGFC